MKFDIVRAWKDEAYHRTLSEEQLSTLPANPAGELSDADLTDVCGGGRPDHGFGFGASSAAASSEHHHHTFAGFCDINIFSTDKIKILHIDELFNTANCKKQVCVNRD